MALRETEPKIEVRPQNPNATDSLLAFYARGPGPHAPELPEDVAASLDLNAIKEVGSQPLDTSSVLGATMRLFSDEFCQYASSEFSLRSRISRFLILAVVLWHTLRRWNLIQNGFSLSEIYMAPP